MGDQYTCGKKSHDILINECHLKLTPFLLDSWEKQTPLNCDFAADDEVTFVGRPLVLPDWSEAATVYGQAYYHGCLMCHLSLIGAVEVEVDAPEKCQREVKEMAYSLVNSQCAIENGHRNC